MFRELEIKRYRGLQEIILTELGRINIIIGENNSGKTSILEAIQLFDNGDVLSNIISVARRRETQFAMNARSRLMPFDMLLYSFAMQDSNWKEIDVRAVSSEFGQCRVGIRGEFRKEFYYPEGESEEQFRRYEAYSDENGYIRVLSGEYYFERGVKLLNSYYFDEIQRTPTINGEEDWFKRRKILNPVKEKICYISPMDIYSNKIISASLYKGMLVEEKRRLLELLQMFDERIIGIETGIQYGYPATFIEMEDCGLVPISIFGDGLKKILTLASAIVKMRGGVVLIDEFETGIHKRALVQVAKWLANVTERYNVQVFLTTHSRDAIDALVEAQADSEFSNINTYRLEHYKSNIYVKKFRGTDLHKITRNQGMDIL